MAYTGTSIVDYLKSVNQDSSYTARSQLASQYGIQNYTGTAAQNTQLLSTLNQPTGTTTPTTSGYTAPTGSLTTTNAPLGSTQATNDLLATASQQTGIPAQTFTNPTLVPNAPDYKIPTSTLQGQTQIPIPPPPAPTNNADVLMAGATDTSSQLSAEATRLSAEEQQVRDKTTELSKLYETIGGQGQATLDAENAAGIPAMQQALQGINSQIQTKLAEYNKIQAQYGELIQTQEGRTIPMNLIIGREAEINRSLALQKNTFAAEIGLLQASAQGLQGQIELATQTADRAVDLKYEDIYTQIKIKEAQLGLVRDMLTDSQAKQADALALQYQQTKDDLSIQTALEKDKNATLLNAMQAYPDAGILLTDTLEQANSKIVSSSQIYSKEVAPKTTTTSGGTTSSTSGISSGSGSTTYQRIISGGGTLSSLTPSERTKVENQLYQDGFYSSTPPKWFVDQLNKQTGVKLPSAVMQSTWDQYRNSIIGTGTKSTSTTTQSSSLNYDNY